MDETKTEKPRSVKTTEYLRYDFTESEFLEHAKLLGRMNQELERSEDRKKTVTSELAADVKRHQDEVSNQSKLVTNGYEYRDIECEVRFHDPEKGKKSIYRCDTGELVRTGFMTGSEMQEAFEFDDGRPVVEATAAAAAPAEIHEAAEVINDAAEVINEKHRGRKG